MIAQHNRASLTEQRTEQTLGMASKMMMMMMMWQLIVKTNCHCKIPLIRDTKHELDDEVACCFSLTCVRLASKQFAGF